MIFTDTEAATVLAALRCWQSCPARGEGTDLDDIATNSGTLIALDADAIEDLCDRINQETQ